MDNLVIENKGDQMVLKLNKKGFDENYLIALVKRLQITQERGLENTCFKGEWKKTKTFDKFYKNYLLNFINIFFAHFFH